MIRRVTALAVLAAFCAIFVSLSPAAAIRMRPKPIVPAPVAHPDGMPAQWFTQRLTHFNLQNNQFWQQRYFVNESFWNPEKPGPIFFQVGGEGAIDDSYVTLFQMSDYARALGALQLSLEHRFYGLSQPFASSSEPLATENFVYLSTEEALADIAWFLNAMRIKYNTTAPIVVFGCSYPGMVASYLRTRFPHLIVAAVASSAPVQAVVDFSAYLDVTTEAIDQYGSIYCKDLIANATAEVESLLKTGSGQHTVMQSFNLCQLPSAPLDISNLMSSLMGVWMGVEQYNDELPGSANVTGLCDIMVDVAKISGPLAAYAQVFKQFSGPDCADISYADMIADLQNTSLAMAEYTDRPWIYQTCVEYGFYQSTDSPNQPFGTLVPVSFYTNMCKDVFGFAFDPQRIADSLITYGGNNIPANSATQILYVSGEADPWSPLEVRHNLGETLLALQDPGAHCEDVMPPEPWDPAQTLWVRQQTLMIVERWLASKK